MGWHLAARRPRRSARAQVSGGLGSWSVPALLLAPSHRGVERKCPEVGRIAEHRYGAYDPSPVVSSRICLASPNDEAGTSTSLGPADKKSGASKPGARWISDGIPAYFNRPSINSAELSSGAAATCTHVSSMSAFYPSV